MNTLRVGIVGATSLTSQTLLKSLIRHPRVQITLLTSDSRPDYPAATYFPFLRGVYDGSFQPYSLETMLEEADLVFLAKQHGEFLTQTSELYHQAKYLNKDITIIDLSADFRLKDSDVYRRWYKLDHTAVDLLERAVYGLPELYRDAIRSADLIANPGCYPTTAILGAVPFLHHRLVGREGIIVDAYSGTSGAGMRPNERNLAIATMENILPYKIGSHQHTPEIEQELSRAAGGPVTITFAPHVAPFRFGMLANIYLKPHQPLETEQGIDLLKEFYRGEPFVRIMEKGEFPEVKDVAGTNWCHIGYCYDSRTNTAVVLSVIDNAIKGASGQAVQNMNIRYGWDESLGLI
ncbi:MAG TPA: N-acetyl-gamma-glutamyl-phosphate reductase [Thermodesulfobacteriota bacterium]|nr:N-acetyl-gamma-glutamyl-phosphate reductase [Deltaproteobacteria bacterium]HNR13914.1 N-acetyl-gamma-glutamyl-phosphate reductase [Thermodesulfobacteriota bacterium]HNU72258.1 N-acetyl-gamma-glutamyl-phosphate reductase [Thermodesulfobacteriota bacterium]HOC37931.1 N-acetyl-gamma-glutamyl-phosphate reductase [Thermodesulfobacteriota bacterium]HQO77624.1 N-acetyl-gamma-glutamyl-phosphate reductase [Thermodesulfobacteriota bacterium]